MISMCKHTAVYHTSVQIQEVDDVQKELNLKSEEVIYYRQECSNLQSLISKYAIPARENEPVSNSSLKDDDNYSQCIILIYYII